MINFDGEKDKLVGRYSRLKIIVYFSLLSIVTAICFIVNRFSQSGIRVLPAWLQLNVPWEALGTTGLGTLFISICFELYLRDVSDARLNRSLDSALKRANSNLLEDIQARIILDPEAVKHRLSKDMVGKLMLAILEHQTGDALLAKESLSALARHLTTNKKRTFDYHCRITLKPDNECNRASLYYNCFVELSYIGTLDTPELRFLEVNSVNDYNSLSAECEYEVRAIRPPTLSYPRGDERAFRVNRVRVGDLDLEITRKCLNGRVVFVANSDQLYRYFDKKVEISYQYMVKVEKTGHIYAYYVPSPARSLVIEFDCGDVDIGRVNVNDFFVTSSPPKIIWPSPGAPQVIKLMVSEWVFPKSGVLFSWVLKDEMDPDFLKGLNKS